MDVSSKGRFAERTFRRKFFGLHYDNSDQNFLSVKWIRRNVLSVKRPFGETSIRRNVHSVKRPFGETSVRRNGFGEMEFGKTDSAKRPDTVWLYPMQTKKER